jgi:hypothetical protein
MGLLQRMGMLSEVIRRMILTWPFRSRPRIFAVDRSFFVAEARDGESVTWACQSLFALEHLWT